MTEASLDAVIAEPIVQAAEQPANETPEQETTEPEAPKSEEAPFPKKAINALSRKERKIGELRARESAALARIQELESRLATQQPQKLNPKGVPLTLANGEPNPDAYDDFQKYQDDRYDWRQEQREAAKAPKQQPQQVQNEPQLSEEYQELLAERQEDLAAGIKADAEAMELFTKHQNLEIPERIGALFLELEPADAVRVFKVIAREGKLESLMSMSQAKAAMEIGRAQAAKTQSSAPKPLPASRGSTTGAKDLNQATDIDDWFKLRRAQLAKKRG